MLRLNPRILISLILTVQLNPAMAISIPRQLTHENRLEVVKMLGVQTSTKLLSNPYPLGGYSGFEMGLSLEVIDTTNLAKLGCTVGSPGCPNTGEGDQELRLARLMIGKGLFKNVDLFVHFAPTSSDSSMTSYGGALRYSFYEGKFIPGNLSLVASADQLNFRDEFVATTLSADLVAGIFLNDFSFYLGFGQVQSTGTFLAGSGSDATVDPGDPDVSPATNTAHETVSQSHSYLGMTIHFSDFFLAGQLDRYQEPAYSLRLGMRF